MHGPRCWDFWQGVHSGLAASHLYPVQSDYVHFDETRCIYDFRLSDNTGQHWRHLDSFRRTCMGCKLFLSPVHSFVALPGHRYKPGCLQRKHHTVGGPHRNTSSGLAGECCAA